MSMQFYGSGNKVIIERGARIKGVFICKGDNNTIHIGHHVEFVGAFVQAEYNTEIVVGAWGIYSTGLVIRSGDSHSVVDIKSLKRINQPKSIHIADRVWAGYNVSIMKGVEIQHDTIIGASSVVTKSPGEGRCIIAGTPAKVVKRGVFWEKRSLGDNVAESFWDASLKFRDIDRAVYMNDIREPAQRDWKTVALWGAVIISLALHLLR
ncbi:hypothetical protein ASG25_13525 [Rhizobium sp. Leaf384]|nr:hypothetical protein ASG25_13525 [Rhizobium sp. Leaf384]KQS83741.1 hypothetical protein ASG58_21960 [Rhizobium sp. Leaf383]